MNQTRRCGAVFMKDRVPTTSASSTGSSGGRPADPLEGRNASGSAPVPPTPTVPRAVSPVATSETRETANAVSPEAIAKEEIQNSLEAYRKGYENRNLAEIKRVYPEAPEESLRRLFSSVKSLEYTYTTPLEYVDLNPALGSANVKVGALINQGNESQKTRAIMLTNLFTLKRTDGIWTIRSLVFQRVK